VYLLSATLKNGPHLSVINVNILYAIIHNSILFVNSWAAHFRVCKSVPKQDKDIYYNSNSITPVQSNNNASSNLDAPAENENKKRLFSDSNDTSVMLTSFITDDVIDHKAVCRRNIDNFFPCIRI
jgi:hypothetical protein